MANKFYISKELQQRSTLGYLTYLGREYVQHWTCMLKTSYFKINALLFTAKCENRTSVQIKFTLVQTGFTSCSLTLYNVLNIYN